MLTRQYKLVKMDPNETIINMFTRYINIINGRNFLGKEYSTNELVNKILC